ncbi:hypothetical protein HDU96_000358 [Phlyctochytrium bullatum]|nr:hypothetical protein HDU96_000358 [Phlyctochytrium bullatum]
MPEKMNLDLATELSTRFGLTDETYAEYIQQLVDDDTLRNDEKFQIIKDKEVDSFISDVLEKAGKAKELVASASASETTQVSFSDAEAAALREETLPTTDRSKPVISKEERRRREQLLAKYAYDIDEIVEGADGEAEVLYRGQEKVSEPSIAVNENVARVKDLEQQRRAKMKAEHEKEQQRNKAALEKQLLEKEKEKRRTQKKEKRRM